jgi:hypothetical protein
MERQARAMMKYRSAKMKDTESRQGGKAYRKPRLTRYGSLRELTTGGSQHANEDAQGEGVDNNKKRP